MDIRQRLEEFYRRLAAAPPARDAAHALALVCRLIEEVEDEWCPVPRQTPPPLRYTGRMYAPRPDHVRRLVDGTLVAHARHHRICCQPDGGIIIVRMSDRRTEFAKPGFTP